MELYAKDTAQLQTQLSQWGIHAPDRLARRGRQKELDRWVLNRLLRGLAKSGQIGFPISVKEDENPDFYVTFGDREIGVEITEAVDQSEQEAWTRQAREDLTKPEPEFREIDLEDFTRPKRARESIIRAHAKKSKTCSSEVQALLMYWNTASVLFERPETLLKWLDKAIPQDTRFQFVWAISGAEFFDLLKMEHFSISDTD